MSAHALEALAAAESAGVKITLDGDGLILEADPLPPDIVALLRTAKPDFLRVLAGREAARAALNAPAPPDCMPQSVGLPPKARPAAVRQRRLRGPGGHLRLDSRRALPRAASVEPDDLPARRCSSPIAGWSQSPNPRSRLKTRSGSRLKFRRIGREHLA